MNQANGIDNQAHLNLATLQMTQTEFSDRNRRSGPLGLVIGNDSELLPIAYSLGATQSVSIEAQVRCVSRKAFPAPASFLTTGSMEVGKQHMTSF